MFTDQPFAIGGNLDELDGGGDELEAIYNEVYSKIEYLVSSYVFCKNCFVKLIWSDIWYIFDTTTKGNHVQQMVGRTW